MGYKGNFESYKNLTKDYSSNIYNNRLFSWNRFKSNRNYSNYSNQYNKGFIRRFINFLKYGSLGRNII